MPSLVSRRSRLGRSRELEAPSDSSEPSGKQRSRPGSCVHSIDTLLGRSTCFYTQAMHMVLTGQSISAVEAEKAGLVASVHPIGETLQYAISQAEIMAGYSSPILYMAKESVNKCESLRSCTTLSHSSSSALVWASTHSVAYIHSPRVVSFRRASL